MVLTEEEEGAHGDTTIRAPQLTCIFSILLCPFHPSVCWLLCYNTEAHTDMERAIQLIFIFSKTDNGMQRVFRSDAVLMLHKTFSNWTQPGKAKLCFEIGGAVKIDFRKNLGFWPNKFLLKFSETKFALVNGYKCDETHNT